MSDDVDVANDQAQQRLDILIKQARKPLAKGEPGECNLCGEYSGRLIETVCALCRDRYKLR